MKIVLCTHRFLPRFTGGVEIYTLRLACALQEMGHEVHIIAGEPMARKDLGVETQEDKYEGIPVSRLIYDYDRRPVAERASYSDPRVTTRLKEALQKQQPDIVHATSLSLLMAGVIEAATGLALPLVYTATDFVLTCRRGTYLKRDNRICSAREDLALCTACMGPHTRLERLLNWVWQFTPRPLAQPMLEMAQKAIGKKADFVQAEASLKHRLTYLPQWINKIDQIIAPSTYVRDMFILNGFSAEKITVSPYGVASAPPNFNKIPSPQLRFGFIGRITFIKGVHLLLEAFAALPEADQPKVHLTIYGGADVKSDKYMQELQKKAARLPNITFKGRVDNANISQIYRHLDCLIVPSLWPENSPITILEAQAHGIPVIASDVGGIRDLVHHEVNGLIFANQWVDGLAHQLARCLTEPELLPQLANNSRLIQSIAQEANQLTKLYHRLAGRSAPNRGWLEASS